mmetsp:Transcript_84250/g.216929  ORF Transcript_84250/g.216929 Transcript_84250/m.216929 type:complete len:108 (-) Transcript_84250:490-813(-)
MSSSPAEHFSSSKSPAAAASCRMPARTGDGGGQLAMGRDGGGTFSTLPLLILRSLGSVLAWMSLRLSLHAELILPISLRAGSILLFSVPSELSLLASDPRGETASAE